MSETVHNIALLEFLQTYESDCKSGRKKTQQEYEDAFPDIKKEIADELAYLTSPEQLGRFEIRKRLGQGGMGTVYHAVETDGLHREVALKVLRRQAMLDGDLLPRFDQEARALARMGPHPHIATPFESGELPDGRRYYSMQYVEGDTLLSFCDHYQLTIEERIELFLQVCDGIAFVHQHGVWHRDIKPGNVMVQKTENGVHATIIDFGIAKSSDVSLTENPIHTLTWQVLGTPAYMSPEQADGMGQLDCRTDVFSLGAVLYELVVGEKPRELGKLSIKEVSRVLHEEPCLIPSARLSKLRLDRAEDLAADRSTNPRDHIARVCGDIDWVVNKAIEAEPADRYSSVSALAADLRRHLGNETISARPPTVLYRLRKFSKRHPVVLAVVLSLAVGISATTGFAIQSWLRQRAHFQTFKHTASEYNEFVDLLLDEPELATEQMRSLRRRIFERPLAFYEDFGERYQGKPEFEEQLASTLLRMAAIQYDFASMDQAREAYRRCEALLAALAAHDPSNDSLLRQHATSLHGLGNVLDEGGKYEESASCYERASAALGRVLATDESNVEALRDLAETQNSLGSLHKKHQRFESALLAHGKALKTRERVQLLAPNESDSVADVAASHVNIGNVRSEMHQLGRAAASRKKATEVFRDLHTQHPDEEGYVQRLATALDNLGLTNKSLGNRAEARGNYKEALELRSALAESHPQVTEYARELAASLANSGILAKEDKEYSTALQHYCRALEIRLRLQQDNPETQAYKWYVAKAYGNLGNCQQEAGMLPDAIVSLTQSRDVLEELFGLSPGNIGYAVTAAIATANLGNALYEDVQMKLAEKNLRQAIERLREHPQYSQYLAITLKDLARLEEAVERSADAAATSSEAIELFETFFKDHPETKDYQIDMGEAYLIRARVSEESREPEAVKVDYGRAWQLWKSLQNRIPTSRAKDLEYLKEQVSNSPIVAENQL